MKDRLAFLGSVLREYWFPLIPLSSLYLAANVALYAYIFNGDPLQLYRSYPLSYTVPFTAFTALISILTGILAVLIIAKLREVRAKTLGLGATGLLFGSLAAGCPGCVFGLFPLLLGFFGLGGTLAVLPLKGIEFQIVTVVLLGIGIFSLSKEADLTCEVRGTASRRGRSPQSAAPRPSRTQGK